MVELKRRSWNKYKKFFFFLKFFLIFQGWRLFLPPPLPSPLLFPPYAFYFSPAFFKLNFWTNSFPISVSFELIVGRRRLIVFTGRSLNVFEKNLKPKLKREWYLKKKKKPTIFSDLFVLVETSTSRLLPVILRIIKLLCA